MVTQLSPDKAAVRPTLEDVNEDLDRVLVGDLLDSIPTPTCEVHIGHTLDAPLCGKPAAWLATALPCGHTGYYCAGCYAHAKRHLGRRGTRAACPLHTPALRITVDWRAL